MSLLKDVLMNKTTGKFFFFFQCQSKTAPLFSEPQPVNTQITKRQHARSCHDFPNISSVGCRGKNQSQTSPNKLLYFQMIQSGSAKWANKFSFRPGETCGPTPRGESSFFFRRHDTDLKNLFSHLLLLPLRLQTSEESVPSLLHHPQKSFFCPLFFLV